MNKNKFMLSFLIIFTILISSFIPTFDNQDLRAQKNVIEWNSYESLIVEIEKSFIEWNSYEGLIVDIEKSFIEWNSYKCPVVEVIV